MTPASVYIAARPDGAHKVGYSSNPQKRRAALATALQQPVAIVDHRECDRKAARQVEKLAHEVLQQFHVGGEWFAIDANVAVAAVETALARFAAGERSRHQLTRDVEMVDRLQPYWAYARYRLADDDFDEELFCAAWRAIMGAMAEFERELIVERTKAGLEAAARAGRKGGARPQWTEEGRAAAQLMIQRGDRVKDVQAATGISRAMLYRWKKEMAR